MKGLIARLGWLGSALLIVALGAAVFLGAAHLCRHSSRASILQSDPQRLERLGLRLIVGYKDVAKAKALVEKQAIAGIFLSTRNVQDHSAEQIRAEIDGLQAIRKAQGLPRLIVAADQEGGIVSHLSPPLKLQPSLGSAIAGLNSDAEREMAVRAYAATQARELQTLGVNMNFGPVVDLQPSTIPVNDSGSRIHLRAISGNPELVAKVAAWYCDTLAEFDIICTLKHFPGLGRVANDTHVAAGTLTTAEAQLELEDWLPFLFLKNNQRFAMMVGHVHVNAIDPAVPASYSSQVIGMLLRSRWKVDGLIVTDDFGMGAILGSKDGIGEAAVKALNAGVDLVLLSNSDKHFDTVMTALIKADREDLIRKDLESETFRRILHASNGHPQSR
jgi:beta-N-acetylhexosaminidase